MVSSVKRPLNMSTVVAPLMSCDTVLTITIPADRALEFRPASRIVNQAAQDGAVAAASRVSPYAIKRAATDGTDFFVQELPRSRS